jgi:cytochrome b involved in lipid metabolism
MKKPYTKVVNAYKCYKELYHCTNDNILKEMYINNIILRIRSIEETNIKELIKEGLILSYKYWNNLFAAVLIHYTKRLVRKHTNKNIF